MSVARGAAALGGLAFLEDVVSTRTAKFCWLILLELVNSLSSTEKKRRRTLEGPATVLYRETRTQGES
jgi:hypothetical protein